MKHLLLFLLCVSISSAVGQERRRVRVISSDGPLELRLGGKTEWQMEGGVTLKIGVADGVTKVFTPQQTIIEFSTPESVEEVVPNRTGSCLLLRVMIAGPGGGYSRLVRISRDPKSQWTPQTVLAADTPPINEIRSWLVREIGAVSDTGQKALLRVGQADKKEGTTFRMDYSWQTWLLNPSKKVADGIRVPSDFDK
jgi:hypothetical protein